MGLKIKLGHRQSLIPPGRYRAKVTKICESKFAGTRRTFHFNFQVADGEFQGAEIKGFVNANYESFSEHTKLKKWLDKVAKTDSEVGEILDLDIFFDKILVVLVETKSSKRTKNQFSNVVDILEVYHEL